MIAWATILIPLLSGLALIALIGGPIALALRTRGFAFALVTIPVAFALIAVASLATPFIGVSWNALSPFALSLIVAVTVWFISRNRAPLPAINRTRHVWWPLMGTLFTGLILTYTFTKSLAGPDAISQTYDGVFHLNAVQYILDTGSASPLDLDLASPGNSVFYPSLWHAFVTLIVQISGTEITVATNATAIIMVFAVWSVGALGFVRAITGSGLIATVVASISAATFAAFPLSFISYGVLFPNLLSLALVPYALVGLLHMLGMGQARRADPLPLFTAPLLFLGALGASTLAHPNALHTMLILGTPFLLFALLRFLRGTTSTGRKTLAVVGFLTVLATAAPLWYIARRNSNPWGGSEGPFGALIEALGTNPIFDGHNWVVSFFVLAGVILALPIKAYRPFVLGLTVVIAFFVLAEGFPPFELRAFILSPWYSDPWRLAALLPLMMMPLAAIGATHLAKIFLPAFRRWLSFFTRDRSIVTIAQTVVLYLIGVTLIATSLFGVSQRLDDTYLAQETEARVLSLDERALLERLDAHVDEDQRIMSNPWNGSALAYALSGREVLVPHLSGTYSQTVWEAMDGITLGEPTACQAAESLNAHFVLDFGTAYVFKNPENLEPQLKRISGIFYAPALTEIDREGEAVLYKITGCNWKDTP